MDSIKVDLKRNNSHLKKRRRKNNGKRERKWTKTVWRGIKGVVSPTGFPYSFPQNVNKCGEKWGKVV